MLGFRERHGDERPPGPRGTSLLGVLPALKRDPIAVFAEAARSFGDVAYLRIGSQHGYLATNPDDIRHVLQDNARNYHKSPLYDKLRTTLGNGLVTSEDAYWLRQRRLAQPAFHRQRIEALAAVMTATAQETADRWERFADQRQAVDVVEEMMRLTQTIVLRCSAPISAQWLVSSIPHGRSSMRTSAKVSGRWD